jgi:hypothetical protein
VTAITGIRSHIAILHYSLGTRRSLAGEDEMRTFIITALLAATVPTTLYAASKPQPTRYCLQYRGGSENCGFLSMQQCMRSLSGDGGMCVVAAIQDPRIKKPAPVTPMTARDEDDTE